MNQIIYSGYGLNLSELQFGFPNRTTEEILQTVRDKCGSSVINGPCQIIFPENNSEITALALIPKTHAVQGPTTPSSQIYAVHEANRLIYETIINTIIPLAGLSYHPTTMHSIFRGQITQLAQFCPEHVLWYDNIEGQ